MKLKSILTIFLLLGFCLLSLTCKSPTAPGENVQPGSRNYTWTVDTVITPMNSLGSIWGASPNDIWTGGQGGTGWTRLFHYDGVRWTNWSEYIGCTINTLYGFSANDVWMGGEDGKIWHFDGSHWTENFVYRPENAYTVEIMNIYGTNYGDVYAVGVISYSAAIDNINQRGFILHNDGSGWKEVYRANYYSQFALVRGEDGIIFILNWTFLASGDFLSIYQFDGMVIKEIYSGMVDTKGFARFDEVGGKVYFILSHGIYLYEYTYDFISKSKSGSFVKQFSIDDPNFYSRISGRNEKDILVSIQRGMAHWNGSDLQNLVVFSNNYTYGSWPPSIFEKDIFFPAYDASSGANFVFHGKLIK
jgi:hypothetical protein